MQLIPSQPVTFTGFDAMTPGNTNILRMPVGQSILFESFPLEFHKVFFLLPCHVYRVKRDDSNKEFHHDRFSIHTTFGM